MILKSKQIVRKHDNILDFLYISTKYSDVIKNVNKCHEMLTQTTSCLKNKKNNNVSPNL